MSIQNVKFEYHVDIQFVSFTRFKNKKVFLFPRSKHTTKISRGALHNRICNPIHTLSKSRFYRLYFSLQKIKKNSIAKIYIFPLLTKKKNIKIRQ